MTDDDLPENPFDSDPAGCIIAALSGPNVGVWFPWSEIALDILRDAPFGAEELNAAAKDLRTQCHIEVRKNPTGSEIRVNPELRAARGRAILADMGKSSKHPPDSMERLDEIVRTIKAHVGSWPHIPIVNARLAKFRGVEVEDGTPIRGTKLA